MRWPAYVILAYVAVGLQIGLGEYLRIGAAKPDLVLMAAIFIAIHAPREPALLGCFGLGLIADLIALNPLGLSALAYALAGMFTVSTQEYVYKSNPLTNFSLGFVGGCLSGAVVLIHGWIRGPRASMTDLLACALYTAILAPLVLGSLNLVKRGFAFTNRRRARAL
jgi:rod shape-determining protein MreD